MAFPLALIPAIGGLIGKVIDKAVPEADLAEKLKGNITQTLVDNTHELDKIGGDIIKAEAQGESVLQRNWRPATMLVFLGLLVMYWFDVKPENLSDDVLTEIFGLLKLGLGGYVVGRSAEKCMKLYKEK